MGVDASAVGGVSVGEVREAVVLYNADPPVRAPNSWIIRIGIFTALSTISFSRTVYMQISDLERSAASMNRISFAGARGRGHLFFLPVVASHSSQHGEAVQRGSRPGSRGATLLILFAQFFRAHGAYFLVITRTISWLTSTPVLQASGTAELYGIGEDNTRQLHEAGNYR